MSNDLDAIRRRAHLVIPQIHLGDAGSTGASPFTLFSPLLRHPGMVATGSNGVAPTNVPWNASISGNLQGVIERVNRLLGLSLVDWGVSRKEAGSALESLSKLGAEDLFRAVEAIGVDRLTRLENSVAEADRAQYATTIATIRAARNAPIGAPDTAAFLHEANRTLHGMLAVSMVTAQQARHLIDQLRRFEPDAQNAIFDELGPGKLQWLTASLSAIDHDVYAPTVARIHQAHVGAINRADAARGLAPTQVTQRFLEILEKVERGEMKLDPAKHGGVTYLFVPGLVTEHQDGYFERNMQRLKDRGLEVQLSKIDTDADIDTNAPVIRREVADLSHGEPSKVFLVSHSKGGPDTRRALQDEATERSTFFWNAMQSACGTPVASTLMEGFMGDIVETTLTRLFRATNGNALRDLDYKRQKQLFLNARPIEVPVLSLATSVGDHPSALKATSDIMHQRYQIDSDGLVPKLDQIISGKHAWSIELDGIDHAAPASRPLPPLRPKHDPADLQEAQILLAWELQQGLVR